MLFYLKNYSGFRKPIKIGDNMESDPPKKKKKYIKANTVGQPKQSIPEPTKLLPQDKNEGKALERSRFDYSFQEIVNHLLARLLPNPNFTIKLSQRLIFGEQKQLDNFVSRLDDNSKYTTGISLSLKQAITKEDIEYKMAEHYRGKVFNARLIEMSVKNFFEGTKYERSFVNFLDQFKNNSNRVYVRLNKEYLNQFLQAIKDVTVVPEKQEAEPVKRRGNRTVFKSEIASVQIQADEVCISDVNKFFSRSDKMDLSDLSITKNLDENGEVISYKFALVCYQQNSTEKIQAFNYYFLHQNFILMPLNESKHKDSICRQYGSIKLPHIRTKIIRGYKSSKWDDKSLLYKIMNEKISPKKTNYTNQYFEAIHLKGLLPTVKSYIEELEQRINQVPLDDVKEEVFVQFQENIKDHIRNSKAVEEYIEKFILEYMKQFSQICVVERIKFPLRGVKLNLAIKNNSEDQFQHIKHNINKIMPKYIIEQKVVVDFSIDEELLKRLQSEHILVVRHQEKDFVYLTSTDDLTQCSANIQKILREFECIGEQYLEVVGLTKMLKYLDIVQTIKKQNQEFAKLLIPEPTTDDKVHYKINFYGPRKKNDKFLEEVKKKIGKIQSELGQYSQFIDERIGKIIVEDHKIQQKIQDDFHISLIVRQCKIEAMLEVELKKQSKIYLLKSNNLEKMPIGCQIYFQSKAIVEGLKEKYLQKFKINVKRYRQKNWYEDAEKTREYQLLFKDNLELNELLDEVASRYRMAPEKHNVGFILPPINPTVWLRQLFDLLTQSLEYSDLALNFYILITDTITQTIDKIVDIPQYSPFTADRQDIEVEWFCQGVPYSKSANVKINDALANRQSEVILQKDDLGLNSITHICDLTKSTIAYHSNIGVKQLQIPFTFEAKSITFKYKNYTLSFPQSEYNKVIYHQKVSLQQRFFINMPFYVIDLGKMRQINIFTNYERPITKNERKVSRKEKYQGIIRAHYNQNQTELIYCFQQKQAKNLRNATQKMKDYIDSKWVQQDIKIKEIPNQDFKRILKERIESRAQEYSLSLKVDQGLTRITVSTFEVKDIDKFRKVLENQVEYLLDLSSKTTEFAKAEIKYPSYWQKQDKEVETFDVPIGTPEFNEVQKLFTVRPIHSLLRIQNKRIYTRYCEELKHLTYLNGKEPKQMKLFHGTARTSSQLIWADTEDGFNINYSSENNMLGRGIYFAQKSQYSYSYKSTEGAVNGRPLLGMMLCSVIVGDSQELHMNHSNKDVRDTNLKPNGIRFESMRGKHDICDIYVVYKNRRAYPFYLIKFL